MRLLFLFCIALSTNLSAQSQFYVSPTGNDGNAGTLLQPWQTVQFALDNAIPGCTINLMSGTYFENAVVIISGTPGNPITLQNYNNQNAIIDGSTSTGGPLLYISSINYFVVKGIEFANNVQNDAQGILVDGICDHVEIRNNKIHDIHFSANSNDIPNVNTNSQPLIVYGDDANTAITNLIISGNEIFNSRTGFSEALAVNGNVDGFEISGNNVHDNSNIGIDIIGHEGTCLNPANDQARNGIVKWNRTWNNVATYATSAGIYVDGARNCTIENNYSYGNGYGIEIGCEAVGKSSSSIITRNNLVYRNLEAGLAIGGYDYPVNSGKVISSSVNGNTIAENNFSGSSSGEMVVNYTESVSFRSNLIYSSGFDFLVTSDANSLTVSFDFNLYYSTTALQFSFNSGISTSLSAWSASCGSDNNSLATNPLLINPAGNNFHLNSTSPAINMGDVAYTPASGERDIDSVNRVQNGRVDIGADEYGTAVGISDFQIPQNIFLFYENSGSELIIHFTNPQVENEIIYLYDAIGKLIESKEIRIGDSKIIFNNAKLQNGIYFANVNGNTMKILQ